MVRRIQIMLNDQQYERLKLESRLTGQSIADLIREAVDHRFKADRDQAWDALLASRGAWADRDDIGSGAEYVERIRQPLEDRM